MSDRDYFYINGRLAISNGQELVGPHIWTIETQDTRQDDVVLTTGYRRRVGDYGSVAVLWTPQILKNTDDLDEVVSAIKAGKFDIWPLRSYGGKDTIAELLKETELKIQQKEQEANFAAKVELLNKVFPEIPPSLKCRIANFDFWYSMSDDGNVYRNGVAKEAELIKELKLIGCEPYFKKYANIYCNRNLS